MTIRDKMTNNYVFMDSANSINTNTSYLNSDNNEYEGNMIVNTQKQTDTKVNWSPTETIKIMTDANTQVNSDIFQIYINEMVTDKCWHEEDVYEFHNLMKLVIPIISAKTYDDIMISLLNPKFCTAMICLLDRLDTMNAI